MECYYSLKSEEDALCLYKNINYFQAQYLQKLFYMLPDNFNIRVYGICINNYNKILISKENYSGHSIVKFPGGGLEYGEGTIDCLKREFREELNVEIKIIEHFYTTDFYQLSAFNKNDQIISIYYTIELENQIIKSTNNININWLSLNELKADHFIFPIDQKVASMLLDSSQLNT